MVKTILSGGLVLVCVASVFAFAEPLAAKSGAYAETIAREYQLKAAFLYNFAKFVEWPPQTFVGPSDAINIGVAGDDAFAELLTHAVEGKVVQGRQLLIRKSIFTLTRLNRLSISII